MIMKKYVKPELFFEKFELNQHVADCAWEMTNLKDKGSCAAMPDEEKIPGLSPLFVGGNSKCVMTEEVFQDFCYQNGTQGVNVFAS